MSIAIPFVLEIIFLIFHYFISVRVIDKYRVVLNIKSFFFEERNMRRNELYSEDITKSIGPHKWWQLRWIKIICMSFIVLTLFTVILSLMLPEKPETTTVVSILLLPVTTTMPTVQHSGKICSDAPSSH